METVKFTGCVDTVYQGMAVLASCGTIKKNFFLHVMSPNNDVSTLINFSLLAGIITIGAVSYCSISWLIALSLGRGFSGLSTFLLVDHFSHSGRPFRGSLSMLEHFIGEVLIRMLLFSSEAIEGSSIWWYGNISPLYCPFFMQFRLLKCVSQNFHSQYLVILFYFVEVSRQGDTSVFNYSACSTGLLVHST